MDNKKSQFTPLTFILIGIVIAFIVFILFSNDQFELPKIGRESKPTENQYKDCISWQETEYYDGKRVCILGKIEFVQKIKDQLTGEIIWHAFFSVSKNSLHLVSVGYSLDGWQGKCVVVSGALKDRSQEDPKFRDGPWMINTENSSDYSIIEVPMELCQ